MNPILHSPMHAEEPPIVVWIVEDHEILRTSLQRLCSHPADLTCTHAYANAEGMLTALKKFPPKELPDVMLLDVGLPGRSGLEVMPEIFEHAPECRVVILTVFEDEHKISAAISAGASGYLLKTAKPDDIIEAIHEAAQGGSPMSPAIVSSVVKLLAKLTRPTVPVDLSAREHEMLVFITEGLAAKEIADRLGVSIHTINSHTRQLFRKLGVHSRAAAVARALREGMV